VRAEAMADAVRRLWLMIGRNAVHWACIDRATAKALRWNISFVLWCKKKMRPNIKGNF
jgi:hypothetical protein